MSSFSSLKTCAVITPAYQAARWIIDCLQSIAVQEPCDGWRYESRVGVDGCEETSSALLNAGIGHWYSPENVGPFLIRNALIYSSPADAYALFDADDVMLPAYLCTLLPMVGDGIAGSARIPITAHGKESDARLYGNGVAIYSAAAFKKLGGFRPWRIAADADAITRARKLGIEIRDTRTPLYRRRQHSLSLTRSPETAIGSKLRQDLLVESRKLARQGSLYVAPVCAQMVWLEPRNLAA